MFIYCIKNKIAKGLYKKVCQYDSDDKLIKIHNSFQEAADFVGGKPQAISRICRGIRKNHHDFKWKYYLENNKDMNKQEIR